jgi:hypothetical protein
MADTTPSYGDADTLTPTHPSQVSTPKDATILGVPDDAGMKAIVVTDQAAGTKGMKLVERPEPQAAINDVVVEVHT